MLSKYLYGKDKKRTSYPVEITHTPLLSATQLLPRYSSHYLTT